MLLHTDIKGIVHILRNLSELSQTGFPFSPSKKHSHQCFGLWDIGGRKCDHLSAVLFNQWRLNRDIKHRICLLHAPIDYLFNTASTRCCWCCKQCFVLLCDRDRYIVGTLDLMVSENYILVYLCGMAPRNKMPAIKWLRQCYTSIDRRYYWLAEAISSVME